MVHTHRALREVELSFSASKGLVWWSVRFTGFQKAGHKGWNALGPAVTLIYAELLLGGAACDGGG